MPRIRKMNWFDGPGFKKEVLRQIQLYNAGKPPGAHRRLFRRNGVPFTSVENLIYRDRFGLEIVSAICQLLGVDPAVYMRPTEDD